MQTHTFDTIKKGMTFHAGEFVAEDCANCNRYFRGGSKGKYVLVITEVNVYLSYEVRNVISGKRENRCTTCYKPHHFQITYYQKEDMLSLTSLTERQQKTLDKTTKALIEAGVLDSHLSLTSNGQKLLIEWMFDTNLKAFGGYVEKLVTEAKEEAK